MSSKERAEGSNRPKLEVLTEPDIKKIHQGACEILSSSGVMVRSKKAQELLKSAGATIKKDDIVLLPRTMVEGALEKAPGTVRLFNSEGDNPLDIGGQQNYFCANVDCPDFLDINEEIRRDFRYTDAAKTATVVEKMDNIDAVQPTGLLSDIDSSVSDLYSVRQMMANTKKPIIATANTAESLQKMIEMASEVVGGREKLRNQPYLALLSEPISPLKHEKETTNVILKAANEKIPIVCYPMPMAGSTAPASMAGTLVQAHAEEMSALTIIQLSNPGSTMLYGAVASTMDMKSAIFSYGAPELNLMSGALADIAHHFNLPIWGTSGTTDTKSLDLQAAAEISMQVMTAILSGADLVHDNGLMDQASLIDLKHYAFTNEVIGLAKKMGNGLGLSENDLALDVINQVGPGGHFLKEGHTMENFRNFWMPNLFDRSGVGEDVKGIKERLRSLVNKTLSKNDQPILNSEKLNHLDEIIER
jgi:trimethylamine--corrinoid protein Co-methyltransferase